MTDPNAHALAHEEYRALKAEMLLRITIQNCSIFGAVGLFTVCAVLAVTFPQDAAALAFVQSVVTLALALQWCHQGVRQCALKQAIQKRDKDAGRAGGWEDWLPSQRPNGVLGSRWFISTKAVFVGLNAVSILLALPSYDFLFVAACAILSLTTVSLLTNPKE